MASADKGRKLGDVDPKLTDLQRIDPLGMAEEITQEAKPEIIEEVIAGNPYADMDELNDALQNTLERTERGLGFEILHISSAVKKDALSKADDTYYNCPYEEVQRILGEEGFSCVYQERYVEPRMAGVVYRDDVEAPTLAYEIWFNPEGTLVEIDTHANIDYAIEPPMLLGLEVERMTLHYNWLPDPGTFVYEQDREDDPEWAAHVEKVNWSNFTHSGHFVRVSDEEWEDPANRIWIGDHQLTGGGFRHALHNLRANGDFLPVWREQPLKTEFKHHGDTRLTADYCYRDNAPALVAARDQLQMRLRDRYQALPQQVKDCIGPFSTWKMTMAELQGETPQAEVELPSLDYLTDEPEIGNGRGGIEPLG